MTESFYISCDLKTVLEADASINYRGAVLKNVDENGCEHNHSGLYACGEFSDALPRYCVTRRELFTILSALRGACPTI